MEALMHKKNLTAFLKTLQLLPGEITACKTMSAQEAGFGPWPQINPQLTKALNELGIKELYLHQTKAIDMALAKKNVVVVTPTASGKTLCYNIPVIHSILEDHSSRALYIFPTKALSQDQLAEINAITNKIDMPISTCTYDGDTPPDIRTKVRAAGHVVVTNPDMLHIGILPHHTKWIKLFENLRYVVIDELHTYKGVFGSHMSNVIRRLKRICSFYGSNSTFILCSATISNPAELAEGLIENHVELITNNSAPRAEKHVLIYNPPLINKNLGIKASSLAATADIAAQAIANGISTIVFTRSRLNVELLLTYIRENLKRLRVDENLVSGYRGGYLPKERRKIEKDLKSGKILGVVSTNALELGIDIGSLSLAVIHGYPGSISSAWQQIGRAGRRSGHSAAILVASSAPLDQFIATKPNYFFGGSPELARINPNNLYIYVDHVKCSAFELPFAQDESFGITNPEEVLEYLSQYEVLHFAGSRYFWQSDSFPAQDMSLRSATNENYVIIDVTEGHKPRVIGEVDRPSAPMLIHPEAIYFHDGKSYQVIELDTKGMRCYVKSVSVDYYTDADLATHLKVLDIFTEKGNWGLGEVLLTFRPTVYKKIKLMTHENVGYGHIHMDEDEMHTTACWIKLEKKFTNVLGEERLSTGLLGISHLFRAIAPLFLMCDRGDIRVHSMVRDPMFSAPTIYIADNVPGGVGLADGAFALKEKLIDAAFEAIGSCPCSGGCPACTGALGATMKAKGSTMALLEILRSQEDLK